MLDVFSETLLPTWRYNIKLLTLHASKNLLKKNCFRFNHMAEQNLFDVVNNVILKFPADDL